MMALGNDSRETLPPEIPGYRLLDVIGRGSVGTVWRAESAKGGEAAVKIIPFTAFHEPEYINAIIRGEQAVYRAAPQAKIVPILDIGETPDAAWLAMTYFPHGTVERLIGRMDVSRSRQLHVILSLATSLAEIHGAGYFHGDLKPSNVLLDAADVPYLIDFYFAASQRRTRDVVVFSPLGTPRYMSPEQAQGRPMSAMCDLYSFGVLAYELLTGRLPYPVVPQRMQEMIEVIVKGKIIPPQQAASDISPTLSAILVRLLATQPENRHKDMREVAKELSACLDDSPMTTSSARPWWLRWLG